MDLSIIIVNYNVRDYLAECLRSLAPACSALQTETIVVDNASADGSTGMVRQRYPEVRVIANDRNRGFARAVNQGLSVATGRMLVILNPDTLVQADTMTVMLDWMRRNPRCGMAGCMLLNADGSFQLACRRSIPTPWSALAKLTGLSRLFPGSRWWSEYNLTWLDQNRPTQVEAISGAFMMVRPEVIDAVGPLDERFFMYGEDLDWCLRVRQAGWTVDYVPGTRIIHYKGASTSQARLSSRREFYRAMYTFVHKHYTGADALAPIWIFRAGISVLSWLSLLRTLAERLAVQLWDGMLIVAAVLSAVAIRFGGLVALPVFGDIRDYLLFCGATTGVWITALRAHDVYGSRRFSIRRISAAIGWGFLAVSAVPFFVPQLAFSRLVMLYSGFLTLLLLVGWRIGARSLARLGYSRWLGPLRAYIPVRRSLLIGTGDEAAALFASVSAGHEGERSLIGTVSLTPVVAAQAQHLGSAEDIRSIIKEHRIQEIMFIEPPVTHREVIQTMQHCHGLGVSFLIVHREETTPASVDQTLVGEPRLADPQKRQREL